MAAHGMEDQLQALDADSYELETLACHAGYGPEQTYSRDLVPPVSMATTFALAEPSDQSRYRYTRRKNPSRKYLEECLAAVEGAKYAFCFSSGLATVLNISYLIRAHDHVICGADCYGGTYRFFTMCAKRMAIDTTFVDLTDLRVLQEAFRPNTKLVWLEPVSNPSMTVVDVEAIVRITRQCSLEAIIVADNTFLTPCLQKPLEYGVDIVMHSLTKYMNGHSDVLMGSVALNDNTLAAELHRFQAWMGTVPSPFDCFLVNRGLRTLQLRMLRHGDSALQVAQALENNPRVSRVLYPGLPSHPQHELAKKVIKGNCGVLSIIINGTKEQTVAFLKNLKIFALAISLGGFESIIGMPSQMSHAAIPEEKRLALGITDSFVRISVGLENPRDLIGDLEQALLKAIPDISM